MTAAAIVNRKLAAASFGRSSRFSPGRNDMRSSGFALVAYSFPFLDVDLDWHARAGHLFWR